MEEVLADLFFCLHPYNVCTKLPIIELTFCTIISTIYPPCLQQLFLSLFAFCNKIPINQVDGPICIL